MSREWARAARSSRRSSRSGCAPWRARAAFKSRTTACELLARAAALVAGTVADAAASTRTAPSRKRPPRRTASKGMEGSGLGDDQDGNGAVVEHMALRAVVQEVGELAAAPQRQHDELGPLRACGLDDGASGGGRAEDDPRAY